MKILDSKRNVVILCLALIVSITISAWYEFTQNPAPIQPENLIAEAEPSQVTDNATLTVYVTVTGTKYHQRNCFYLRHSKIAILLDEACEAGYEPCSRCW